MFYTYLFVFPIFYKCTTLLFFLGGWFTFEYYAFSYFRGMCLILLELKMANMLKNQTYCIHSSYLTQQMTIFVNAGLN